MRVLFMPAPAIGHTFPMVPLAWAFRAAGHDVVFVTAGDGLAVARAGLPALDALPGRTTSDMLSGFVRDLPELFTPLEGPPIDAMNARKPAIVAAWDPYVDEHVRLAEAISPDLVVYDPIFAVGPVVAAKRGVPAVAHGIGISRFTPDLLRDLPAAVALWRHGVKVPEGIQTIDIAPRSLSDGPPSKLAMRYVPYNGGEVLPEWLLAAVERPRIAFTLGSLLPEILGLGFVDRIAAIAEDVDVEFVVTLGHGVEDMPTGLPPNVRIVGWVPLNALLRTCSAAVHHGGDGTTLTCCALGVPQMVLPFGPPLLLNAEVLRARGAAHVTSAETLDSSAIGALLADDTLRRVASEIRSEIAALPTPADLVGHLTDGVDSDTTSAD